MADRHPYIAIEGAIGAGKTTLARILGENLPAEVLLEVFEQNPFLSDFYADRQRYAFQTQIFFLLSRYRQQHQVIADTIRTSPLASDYLFAKDWLFAHLNLAGDELAMYERVHAILGEQIPAPDLVVYLRASTDTLLQRIAFRDRPYERQMDPDYIQALRAAYEAFFTDYTVAPLLVIESDHLDFVRQAEDRSTVLGQIKQALSTNAYRQPLLPEFDQELASSPPPGNGGLGDIQRAYAARSPRSLSPAAPTTVFVDYMNLSASVGVLGETLARVWGEGEQLVAQIGNRREASEQALSAAGAVLQSALADTLDRLLRMANTAGIDLEQAYLQQHRPFAR